ncbi:SICAvar, type I (fragment) [Plasmodium knowlesi strain H]|uniref:SICAvar, type I n=2 Tax=Plasmodium knowlesi (strain H) TaxID=5851 RepID=A0A1A7W4Z9_PLAKH
MSTVGNGASGGVGGVGGGSSGGSTSLMEAWMKKVLEDSTGGAPGSSLNSGKDIMDKLKEDLEKIFSDLQSRFTGVEAQELADMCFKAGELFDRSSTYVRGMKTFCKGMMEVRYFISGLKSGTKKSAPVQVETTIEEHEWYPRCIVGAVALSTIYGDNCKLGEVIKKIDEEMKKKLGGHKNNGAKLDKCKGLTNADVLLGKALIGGKIREWALADKARANIDATKNKAIQRVGSVMDDRDKLCKQDQGYPSAHNQLKGNTNSMASFLGIVDSAKVENNDSPNLFDVLVNDDLTFPPETLQEALAPLVNTDGSGTVDPSKVGEVMEQLKKESETTVGKYSIINTLVLYHIIYVSHH